MAVVKSSLRILMLERLGETFNQTSVPLRYTPRGFAIDEANKVQIMRCFFCLCFGWSLLQMRSVCFSQRKMADTRMLFGVQLLYVAEADHAAVPLADRPDVPAPMDGAANGAAALDQVWHFVQVIQLHRISDEVTQAAGPMCHTW